MFDQHSATALILGIIGISILLMLVRPRGIPEVYWVGGGALLLIALRLTSLQLAGKAIAEGTDVYLFLFGMMLLSELAQEHGVFDWLSSIAVQHARGSTARLFTLVYGVGTITTIFMSNDATAVVLTPAILCVVKKARIKPLPHLFACAMIANAASFVLPISNPANLVVFGARMPPLFHWLEAFLLPSLLSILVTYLALKLFFGSDLRGQLEADDEPSGLNANGKLILFGLGIVTVALLVASAFGINLGLPTCLAAVVVAGAVSTKARRDPLPLLRGISWQTLALVACLFILVDSAESIGALKLCVNAIQEVKGIGSSLAAMIVGSVVAVANNVVNNLPLGLLAGGALKAMQEHGLLANAVLVGVDLGPNLCVTGSLATILWLLALRKEGVNVSFWEFFKAGAIVMPTALLSSLAVLVLQHALLPFR